MEPKSEPESMGDRPDYHFGTGVLSSNPRHVEASLVGRVNIGHRFAGPWRLVRNLQRCSGTKLSSIAEGESLELKLLGGTRNGG